MLCVTMMKAAQIGAWIASLFGQRWRALEGYSSFRFYPYRSALSVVNVFEHILVRASRNATTNVTWDDMFATRLSVHPGDASAAPEITEVSGDDLLCLQLPLVRSDRPASLRLTADHIAELWEDDDVSVYGASDQAGPRTKGTGTRPYALARGYHIGRAGREPVPVVLRRASDNGQPFEDRMKAACAKLPTVSCPFGSYPWRSVLSVVNFFLVSSVRSARSASRARVVSWALSAGGSPSRDRGLFSLLLFSDVIRFLPWTIVFVSSIRSTAWSPATLS